MADDYSSNVSTSGSITIGRSRSGSIETVGDTDWFRITLVAGVTYRFDLEGSPTGEGTLADTFLRLRNSSGDSITSDDDGGSGDNSRITHTATYSGTYYLSVGSSNNGTGTYRLTTEQTSAPVSPDDYGSSASSAGTVSVDGSKSGTIEKSGDTDWFKTTLIAGHTYQVDVEGSATGRGTLADPYGSIRNSSGIKEAEANDGGTGDNSRFTWTVPEGRTGTYFIAAGSNNNGSGSYRVKLTDVTPASTTTTYSIVNSSSSVNEGGQLTFTITRSGDKPAETLYFSTLADGTATFGEGDYTLAGGGEPKNIVIRFSEGETTEKVTLDIRDDGPGDAGESFRAIVQRDDDDPVGKFLLRTDFVTITEGAQNTRYTLTPSVTAVSEGGQVVFTIKREGDQPAERVYFSAWQDSASYLAGDYRLSTGGEPKNYVVDFDAGDDVKTVTLAILSDGVGDAGERFRAVIQDDPSKSVADNLGVTGFITIDEGAPPPALPDNDDFRDEASDTSTPFGTLNVGSSATGIIGSADANDSFGDKDVFKVHLQQGQAYNFQLTSISQGGHFLPSGLFTIRSPGNFNEVIETSASGTNVSRKLIADVSGDYYLRVGSGGRSGDQGGYQLSVTDITPAGGADDFPDYPGDSGAINGTPTLAMGPSRAGVIEAAGDTDIFAVSLVAGRSYQFSVDSASAGGFGSLSNLYMTLRSGSNFNTRLREDGGVGQATLSYVAPSTGTYFIRVGAGSVGSTGGYRVDVYDKGVVSQPTLPAPPQSTSSVVDDALRQFDYLALQLVKNTALMLVNDAPWNGLAAIMVRMNDYQAAQLAGKIGNRLSPLGIGINAGIEYNQAPEGQKARALFVALVDELTGALVTWAGGAAGGAALAAAGSIVPVAGTISGGIIGMIAGGLFSHAVYEHFGASAMVRNRAGKIFDSVFNSSQLNSEFQFQEAEQAGTSDDFDFEELLVRFDEEWYLSTYPDAAAAVAAGTAGNAYSYYLMVGIDLGHQPNPSQRLSRSDLAVEFLDGGSLALGISGLMTHGLGLYAADGVSVQEAAVAGALNGERGVAGTLVVDSTLSAIANRKATDLVANFAASAAKTAYDSRNAIWAETWSNGNALTQQFRGTFESLLGPDTPAGSYAMFVVAVSDFSASTLMAWLHSQEGFAAAMTNSAFDTVGIAEYGGVWVVIFANRNDSYMVAAPGSDGLTAIAQYGSDELDALYAGSRTAKLYGLAGYDTLIGGSGNDFLDGGADGDHMRGGTGDDTYIVDHGSDTIVEGTGEGTDRILSSVSYTLRAGVYVETLGAASEGGTDALVLAGNELDNRILGNAGDNTLWGMAGDDYLAGYGGDDIYVVDQRGDVVVEAAGQGRDWVFTSVNYTLAVSSEVEGLSAHDRTLAVPLELVGNEFKNSIYGNAGNNYLDGAGGADYLEGGAGDDLYLVDNSNDYITERQDEGASDRIHTKVGYSLAEGVYVEILAADPFAEGLGGLVLAGNELNNSIIGGPGGDTLWGLGGNDHLAGKLGDDTYVLDSALDTVSEAANEGHDRIFSLVSFALAAGSEVELLATMSGDGSDPIDLTGNEFNQSIYGNAGSNLLTGGGGDDYLSGGAGADRLRGGSGNDTYYVDDAGDLVEELAGEGSDTVWTTLAVYSLLGTQIERLGAASDVAHDFRGSAGNNGITGGAGNDIFRLYDGGADAVDGGAGDDIFFLGATLTSADRLDGDDGTDTLVVQGNYAAGLSLSSALTAIESVSILAGSNTAFGEPGTNRYDYVLTTNDANFAAGVQARINGAALLEGEDFSFDGSAETDASYVVYGGKGRDTLLGGLGNDIFFYAEERFATGDTVNGGAGYDGMFLRGNYTIDFNAPGYTGLFTNIENLTLTSATDERYARGGGTEFDYSLVLANAIVGAGQTLTVSGSLLQANETMVLDGSGETDGVLRLFGGAAADSLKGGALADLLHGATGADSLRGGGGADIFRYQAVTESYSVARDHITDFTPGADKIELSAIDANRSLGGDQGFSWIGSNAFSNVAGQLRAFQSGAQWIVQGDINGDGFADLVIALTLQGPTPLGAGDFLL